jgi:two-component system alkaline phosphatase synthesis response regulator PhoP
MAQTILIADDDTQIVRMVRAYLEEAGYRVLSARDGREALFTFRHEKPDLIVLDLMMPEMDGWEAARLIRRESDTPIIMLTARTEDVDKIVGLEMGADDYVTKPFSPRELVARVRAVLRRTGGGEQEPELLRVGELTLNKTTHTVTVAGQPVELTPSEFDLLAVFMAQPNRVFSRLELLERTQDVAYEAYERTIDVHVKNLRGKIEANPREPVYIQTVYGVGYKLVEPDDG